MWPDVLRRIASPQALPDLEQRAAAGVDDLKSRRAHDNGATNDSHHSQAHRMENADMLFLQVHAAQLDVLAPTHRGAYML